MSESTSPQGHIGNLVEVTCPSGLRGTMRGMKVKDEQLFTNKSLVRTGKILGELLAACWQETLDPGPYHVPNGHLDWNQVLLSDRTHAIIQLRVASYGADYEFEVTCSECGKKFGWGVDLNALDVIDVSDTGVEHVKTNKAIAVDLPDGRQVKCRLLTGADEVFFSENGIKEENILTWHLARRVQEIDGHTDWESVLEIVENLNAAAGDHLWNTTDDLEGGVETTFDVKCPAPACGNVQQVILPFGQGFFSTRRSYFSSKRRRSRKSG